MQRTKVDTKTDITIAGQRIHPGDQRRIEIPLTQLATQGNLGMPVEVIRGLETGPKLLVCGAVHGDEINGIEIVRQILPLLSPEILKGTLIAVPIVNIPGFLNQSRYLPDRRDLNRSFPGSRGGSQAARIAKTVMDHLVLQSHYVIDLHTASVHRRNIPQIRTNLQDTKSVALAQAFGAPIVVHAAERDGSLRMAAVQGGVPAIVYEAGEACRFNNDAIEVGILGVLGVMQSLGMVTTKDLPLKHVRKKKSERCVVFGSNKWVRASRGGLFRAHVEPGDEVVRDQFLGFIADAFGEGVTTIRAPEAGMIIGIHCNPVVHHGDALVHLATHKKKT